MTNTCRICGCTVSDLRTLPHNFLMGSYRSDLRLKGFNELPLGCWDICDRHLDIFAKWYLVRQPNNIPPTDNDLLTWVGSIIKTIAKRLQQGFPGGYCECLNTYGNRCVNWSVGYVGTVKACKRHIRRAEEGKSLKLARKEGEDPVWQAAKSLMEGHYGTDRTGNR